MAGRRRCARGTQPNCWSRDRPSGGNRFVIAPRLAHAFTWRDPSTRLGPGPTPEIDRPLAAKACQLDRSLELLAHRPTQIKLHQEPNGQRVFNLPRFRFNAEQPRFRRDPFAEPIDGRVDTCRVVFEDPSFFGRQQGALTPCGCGKAQRPHFAIVVEGRFTEYFCEAARSGTPSQLHLKKPFASVKIAETEPHRGLAGRLDVGNSPLIEQHLDPSGATNYDLGDSSSFR